MHTNCKMRISTTSSNWHISLDFPAHDALLSCFTHCIWLLTRNCVVVPKCWHSTLQGGSSCEITLNLTYPFYKYNHLPMLNSEKALQIIRLIKRTASTYYNWGNILKTILRGHVSRKLKPNFPPCKMIRALCALLDNLYIDPTLCILSRK